MALTSERDCPHGRQLGKCADCDLSHMEMAASAEARRVDELTALRKDDEALIRQMLAALEPASPLFRALLSLNVETASQEMRQGVAAEALAIDAAITAARARLEKAP